MKIPVYRNGDTTFWYSHYNELAQRISLANLPKTDHIYHFRIWMDRQAIELWKEANGDVKGQLTSWAKEYTSDKEEPTNRIASHTINLDSTAVRKLDQLINISRINFLPDQEKIAGWKQGVDGIEYVIELVDKDNYSLRSYWTPSVQGELKEAKLVESFVRDASNVTNALEEWKSFTATIPYECYMYSSITVACKSISLLEKRHLKKERDKYRKTQK